MKGRQYKTVKMQGCFFSEVSDHMKMKRVMHQFNRLSAVVGQCRGRLDQVVENDGESRWAGGRVCVIAATARIL